MNHQLSLFWRVSSWLLALLLVAPVIALVIEAFAPANDVFHHLWQTVLGSYITNSILLVTGVLVVGFILAIPSAWLIVNYEFPGRRQLQWLLVLPMAMPSYIIAYIYTDLFEFAGPVQHALRTVTGWESASDYYFPDIRSLTGSILILSLVLYPYLYLLARAAFLEQSRSQILASRLLGYSAIGSFFKVSLPMARPAIMAGLALIGMETLGDFGTVSYFSVPTLTTAIYDTWLGYGNMQAAAKISSLMLLVVFFFISVEKYSRRKQQLYQKSTGQQKIETTNLYGYRRIITILWCWSIVGFGFILPALMLVYYCIHYFEGAWRPELFILSLNSFLIAGTAALLAAIAAVLLGLYQRLNSGIAARIPSRLASMGYAIPGNVLAIGVIIPLAFMDHKINALSFSLDLSTPGLILSGSVFAIVFAYIVRFSAIAIGSVESSFAKLSPSLDMASRTLGCTPVGMIKRVHIPLARKGLLVGIILVFVESMKELPATILLRPFNFETLATWVFQYVSDESLQYAAPAALVLVLVGLIPLIFLNKSLEITHESTKD